MSAELGVPLRITDCGDTADCGTAANPAVGAQSAVGPQSAIRSRRCGLGGARWILLGLPLVAGCEWFTDFKRQPAIVTWQVVGDSTQPSRTNPLLSVPTTGLTVAGYQVSYAPMPATVDSMSRFSNPVAADARSLENGHRYYQINCAVCHGDRGMGDGPATRFGMVGINIVGEITRARADGYIWGIIRNGRGLMPSYNRIEERSRWDVVNYVRALQGGAPGLAIGVVAEPGATGAAVPGATGIAPTRPVPHWGSPAPVAGAAPVAGDTVPAAPESQSQTATPPPAAPGASGQGTTGGQQ